MNRDRIYNIIAWAIIFAVATGIGYFMALAVWNYNHN